MIQFDQEYIKNSAVSAVTDFLTKKIPLSDTVAFLAKRDQLNTDQIKRLIEATNQIAYLKLFSTASDKTFEFPVAKYETVLTTMSSPVVEKSASENSKNVSSPLDLISSGDMTKQASENEVENTYFTSMTGEEATLMLKRAFDDLKVVKEQLDVDMVKVATDIVSTIKKPFSNSDEFLEAVTYTVEKKASKEEQDEFWSLTKLEKKASDIVDKRYLNDAENLFTLFKQAKEIQTKIKNTDSQLQKCADFLKPKMEKIRPTRLGKAVVKGVSGTAKSVGGFVGNHLNMATNLVAAPTIVTHKNDVLDSLQGGVTY